MLGHWFPLVPGLLAMGGVKERGLALPTRCRPVSPEDWSISATWHGELATPRGGEGSSWQVLLVSSRRVAYQAGPSAGRVPDMKLLCLDHGNLSSGLAAAYLAARTFAYVFLDLVFRIHLITPPASWSLGFFYNFTILRYMFQTFALAMQLWRDTMGWFLPEGN